MSIGSTIKRLRREKNITQEQLADYLGITSRAVSQWECDRTAPDISQIPILCNVLHVSADSLLGIDIEQKEKRINDLLAEAKKQWELGYNREGEKTLRAAHKEYPNNHKIMSDLMSCVWKSRNEPERTDEYDTLTQEVISLGERILAECTDIEIRNNAIQLLCYTYPELNQSEKAIALANQMPNRHLTKESLLSGIYDGTKRFEINREELFDDVNALFLKMIYSNSPLDNGQKPFSNEEMIELYKKFLAIMDIFFEDGNFGFYRQTVGWTNIYLAKLYMCSRKSKEALECLLIAKQHSIICDTEYDEESTYTCLLFRGKQFGGITHNITQNDCLHQLEEMNDKVFDPVRETPDFKEIEKELKKYARHH